MGLNTMLCHVTVRSGPARGMGCIVSNEFPMIFGRQESNDCVLSSDTAISRRHFQVFVENNECWVADLNSRNGTYLNDHPIVSSQLNTGDEITAGNTRLRVRIEPKGSSTSHPAVAQRLQKQNQSSIHTVSQDLIETLVPGVRNEFDYYELSENYVRSKRFLNLVCDLPGLSVVVNHPESAKTIHSFGNAAFEIQKGAYLIYPSSASQVDAILSGYGNSDSILILNSQVRRSALQDRIQTTFQVFRSASAFWDEISQVPREIASRHLSGIDIVVGRSPSKGNGFRALTCSTIDPSVIRELVESVRVAR